jgi:hypothetical protein
METPLVWKEKCKTTQDSARGHEAVGHVEHGPAAYPQEVSYLTSHDAVDEIAQESSENEKEAMSQASVSTMRCGHRRCEDAHAKNCIERYDPRLSSKESERDPLVHRQDEPHRTCRKAMLEKKPPSHPFRALICQNHQSNKN